MTDATTDDRRPEVSVIVPVRNRARLIGPCVASVLEAGYPADRLEVIVVDNASTDGTPEVLARFGGRIRIVREPRRGPAAARNAGIRAARGTVVAFTDSDCVVAPHWVTGLVGPLADPSVGAVGGRIRALPGGNDIEHFGERIHDHAKAIHYFRPAYVITMNLACPLALLHELGGFDERLLRCEDVDLAYRIAQAGRTLAYVPDATVYHHNRSTLVSLMAEGWAHGFHATKLARLHRDYQQRLAGTEPPEPPACARTVFSRALASRRERLYWLLFTGAKRAGRAVGRLRAGKLHEAA